LRATITRGFNKATIMLLFVVASPSIWKVVKSVMAQLRYAEKKLW
jgi:hypothetical protein